MRWAQAVQRLVPSAERVRFTSSGTEATLMAVRLARAFTGRRRLMRFRGHFHGWHDHMTSRLLATISTARRRPACCRASPSSRSCSIPATSRGVRAALPAMHDIAAVILEPTGSCFGQVPLRAEFLHDLRASHRARRRAADLRRGRDRLPRLPPAARRSPSASAPTSPSFAKILAGGLPGAAVAGRRDILDQLDFAAPRKPGGRRSSIPGTFNANPVSAAAGIAHSA